MTEVERIVKGLTKAQREGLLRSPCRSWWGDVPACMPQVIASGFALARKGVCESSSDRVFPITPLGLAVRSHLKEQSDD